MMITQMAYAKERGSVIPRGATGLEEAPDSATMLKVSGLDFEVELAPLYAGTGKEGSPQRRIAGRFATRRTDTLDVLGVGQTEEYHIWQNWQSLQWTDSLVQDGVALYETAGLFNNGEICWALMRFPEGYTIADDEYRNYIFISWGHGGWQQIQAGPTNVRVRCENTFRYARSQASIKIRHTRSIEQNMDQAAKALQVTTEAQRRLKEWLEQAATVDVSSDDLTRVEEHLFGPRNDRSKQADASAERFKSIAALEIGEYGQSAYALFNAVTGFADHVKAGGVNFNPDKPNAVEKRFRSAIDGTAANFKDLGFEIVNELITV